MSDDQFRHLSDELAAIRKEQERQAYNAELLTKQVRVVLEALRVQVHIQEALTAPTLPAPPPGE